MFIHKLIGVEFFHEFNQRKHIAQDLHFDWNKDEVVELKIDLSTTTPEIPWRDYKTWDLVMLTKNYLRLMLSHVADPSPGMTHLRIRQSYERLLQDLDY